jgi:hypothetical protein
MFYSLVEFPGAKDRSKMLVFVRGFQGWNNFRLRLRCCGSEAMARDELEWYCGLRRWGYEGRFLTFQWNSPASDCLSETRRFLRIEGAAEALCDRLSRVAQFDSMETSIVGFSHGGWIIERALRIAWSNDVQVRRVYLFGAAAPCASPWLNLMDCVFDGLWNFYSTREYLLDAFCSDCVGVNGISRYHKKARNIDCSSFIEHHDDWSHNIDACLRRARLSPKCL